MNHARLYDIMSGRATDPVAVASRLGLASLTPGYHLATAIRNKLFDLGIKKTIKLDRPVISVGNITTGGTGKTPMVIELARRLLALNHKPSVLLRGYMAGEKGATSDEARELSHALGEAIPVMPNPNRIHGAQRVLTDHPGVTVFLLDDGFQHRRVHRDLDIVLIDATRPFGFDRLLPRGLLRESKHNLRRADAVIITRTDLVSAQTINDLDQQIEAVTGKPPVAHAAGTWSGYRAAATETGSDTVVGSDYLKTKPVTAACAIGNPAPFENMLRRSAGEVLRVHAFDDHHNYTAQDIQHLLDDAKHRGADTIVVTEKDWVKWRPILDNLEPADTHPQILRPILGVGFTDGSQTLNTLLQSITQS